MTKKKTKMWRVECRISTEGFACVEAATEAEAKLKFDRGEFDNYQESYTNDWERLGLPEEI